MLKASTPGLWKWYLVRIFSLNKELAKNSMVDGRKMYCISFLRSPVTCSKEVWYSWLNIVPWVHLVVAFCPGTSRTVRPGKIVHAAALLWRVRNICKMFM